MTEEKDISYWTFKSFPLRGLYTFITTLPDCKYRRLIDYNGISTRLFCKECECGKCDDDVLVMNQESKERFYNLIKTIKETYEF